MAPWDGDRSSGGGGMGKFFPVSSMGSDERSDCGQMKGPLFLTEERRLLPKNNGDFFSLAFGNSMLPLFEPFSEIQIHPVEANQIRVGDVVAYWQGRRLCAHRVVKIVRRSQEVSWVTKGDNRFQCDSPVGMERIVGQVTRIRDQNLIMPWRSFFGRLMAFLSYYPSRLSCWFIAHLPRGKRLANRWAIAVQPLLLWNRLERRWTRTRRTFSVGHFLSGRIAIRCLRDIERESLADLWNRCFPLHRMESTDVRQRILQSQWFSPCGCLVAMRDSRAVGFVLTSERRYRSGGVFSPGKGFIECIGVDPTERRTGVGTSLLSEAIHRLEKRGCRFIQTGYFPVPCNDQGWMEVPSELTFFGKHGFEMDVAEQEFGISASAWDGQITQRHAARMKGQGILVEKLGQEERPALLLAIRRWGYPEYARIQGDSVLDFFTFLVARQEGRFLGYCRCYIADSSWPYDRLDWIWPISQKCRTGYVDWLCVDPSYRSLGLGAVLTARAIDILLEQGCQEVRGWVSSPALQTRYRRWAGERLRGIVAMSFRSGVSP